MKTDNPFSNKLYTHTVPVREEVWEAVEKRLPPRSEEKSFPFFWVMLFASTLISGALMFGIINKKSNSNPNPVPNPSYTLTTPESPESSTTQGLNSNDINQNSTTSLSEQSESSSSNADKSTASSESSESKANLGSSSSSASAASSSSSASKDFSSNQQSTRNQQKKSSSSKNSSAQNSSSQNSSNQKSNPGKTDLFPAFEESMATESMSAPHASQSAASASTSVSRVNRSTALLPLADVELIEPGEDVIGTRNFKPDPNCYKFSGITGTYYLSVDAFAGPGISPRSFTASDSEATSYSLARQTTENHQYAWSAGARFNFHLQRGWALRLGLLYDQAGDVFDYTDTLATHSTFRIDSFFAADGTFLYSDSSRVLIFGTLIKKIHNTYRHLDVPILVSYEMPIGRSSLMFNVGPVFNLSSSYEGQILDPMLHPRTITPGSQNELYAYKTSLGLSLYFGAGLVLPITDNISGVVEPRYLYRIKPVTIKSYPLEEHRHFAGLNLGLRYYLK